MGDCVALGAAGGGPVLVHTIAPVSRVKVCQGLAPIAPGVTAPAAWFRFKQPFRVLWVQALVAGVDPGVGLNSLELLIKSSLDDRTIFDDFVPFSALVGQNGARVLPFDLAEDEIAYVGPSQEWEITVRNVDALVTYEPRILLGVLCGHGDGPIPCGGCSR